MAIILATASLRDGEAQIVDPATQALSEPSPPAGSATTIIQGKSAQRLGDVTRPGAVVSQGSPNVLIDGRPAAIAGSGCANGINIGSANVFINGKPAARAGDASTPCER
jgi:uncharacterized Zn-binding protein involved in type VI secretion